MPHIALRHKKYILASSHDQLSGDSIVGFVIGFTILTIAMLMIMILTSLANAQIHSNHYAGQISVNLASELKNYNGNFDGHADNLIVNNYTNPNIGIVNFAGHLGRRRIITGSASPKDRSCRVFFSIPADKADYEEYISVRTDTGSRWQGILCEPTEEGIVDVPYQYHVVSAKVNFSYISPIKLPDFFGHFGETTTVAGRECYVITGSSKIYDTSTRALDFSKSFGGKNNSGGGSLPETPETPQPPELNDRERSEQNLLPDDIANKDNPDYINLRDKNIYLDLNVDIDGTWYATWGVGQNIFNGYVQINDKKPSGLTADYWTKNNRKDKFTFDYTAGDKYYIQKATFASGNNEWIDSFKYTISKDKKHILIQGQVGRGDTPGTTHGYATSITVYLTTTPTS